MFLDEFHSTEALKGFHGLLQCDGYQGYNKVEGVALVCCQVHCRRKFYKALPKEWQKNKAAGYPFGGSDSGAGSVKGREISQFPNGFWRKSALPTSTASSLLRGNSKTFPRKKGNRNAKKWESRYGKAFGGFYSNSMRCDKHQ
nr:transposase [uncultured Marvinbryantia sp.]